MGGGFLDVGQLLILISYYVCSTCHIRYAPNHVNVLNMYVKALGRMTTYGIIIHIDSQALANCAERMKSALTGWLREASLVALIRPS